MKNNILNGSLTHDQVLDRYIGKKGTRDRDEYEFELKTDLLGDMIRQIRRERKMTQTQLGEMIGVQKAQISKLERSAGNVTISTILKVFKALKTGVKIKFDIQEEEVVSSL